MNSRYLVALVVSTGLQTAFADKCVDIGQLQNFEQAETIIREPLQYAKAVGGIEKILLGGSNKKAQAKQATNSNVPGMKDVAEKWDDWTRYSVLVNGNAEEQNTDLLRSYANQRVRYYAQAVFGVRIGLAGFTNEEMAWLTCRALTNDSKAAQAYLAEAF